jgi:hypothetical protein
MKHTFICTLVVHHGKSAGDEKVDNACSSEHDPFRATAETLQVPVRWR